MDLAAAVQRYLEITGGFDRPLHLSQFGLPKAETERMVSAWDEDYQISRYQQLLRKPEAALVDFPVDRRVFLINGHEVTHLSFHPDIRKML